MAGATLAAGFLPGRGRFEARNPDFR